MSSNNPQKHYIQEEFQQILNNFIKALLFYRPKDIIDFAINYFVSLERKIPLDKLLESQKYINSLGSESTLNNEQNITNEENINLDDTNSLDNLEDNQNNDSNIKIPMSKEFKKILKIKEIENKGGLKKETNDFEISATNTDRDKVKDFVSELFIN